MKGFDGIQGQVYVRTCCVFNRIVKSRIILVHIGPNRLTWVVFFSFVYLDDYTRISLYCNETHM